MVLTVDFLGAADFKDLHPPALSRFVARKDWKLDDISAKTDTFRDARRLTYRVRPLKEGVVWFPALTFEYAGADGYTVYRSEDDNTFKLVKHVTSCDTYNYSLENGKTYAYKVRPYRVLDSGSKQYLAESGSVAIPIGVKTPDNLNVRANGKTSMEISWDGDPMADSYRLYRSTDNTNWTLIKSVYGTSTITYGLHEGETYYFRVKATRNINTF